MHTQLDLDVACRASLPEGPKILAANHPTTTDPFYLLTLTQEQMNIMVTGATFEVPGFGAYLRAAGHVPVVAGSGGTTVEAAIRLLKEGGVVGIFPEGALSPLEFGESSTIGELGFCKARSGVARIALETGVPVIPVGISLDPTRIEVREIEVREIEVESGVETARLYLNGPYAMTVGEPMTLEGDINDWDEVKMQAQRVMDRIAALSRESQARLRAVPLRASET